MPDLPGAEGPEEGSGERVCTVSNGQLGFAGVHGDLVNVFAVAEIQLPVRVENSGILSGDESPRHGREFFGGFCRVASLAGARACVVFQGVARLPGPPTRFGQTIIGGELRASRNWNEGCDDEQGW